MKTFEKMEECPRCGKTSKESENDFQWFPFGWDRMEVLKQYERSEEVIMLKRDFFFHYSNRYRHGSFDMREVTGWKSKGIDYYLEYILSFKDSSIVTLDGNEFKEFEEKFNKLEDKS